MIERVAGFGELRGWHSTGRAWFAACRFWCLAVACIALGGAGGVAANVADPDVRALIAAVIDQTRGQSSYAEMSMLVKRPDWERNSALTAWTRGRDEALIRFTQPARDAGNSTLKKGEQMWTYTPKLRRVIRLPYSLMSQSWAGSDFSYNDLSRTDSLLQHYDLELTGTEQDGDHTIYTIQATPHEDAPIVWGREVIVLRDDYVLLQQTYYDQDFQPVKVMKTLEVGDRDGRAIPLHMRMSDLTKEGHFTELRYGEIEFDIDVSDRQFTRFALQNP